MVATLAYNKDGFYGYLVQMTPDRNMLPNGDELAPTYWSVAPAHQNGLVNQTWYASKDEIPFELREVDMDEMRYDS